MSLAKVQNVSLRELFDASAEDIDFLLFTQAVVNMTINIRAEQLKHR